MVMIKMIRTIFRCIINFIFFNYVLLIMHIINKLEINYKNKLSYINNDLKTNNIFEYYHELTSPAGIELVIVSNG